MDVLRSGGNSWDFYGLVYFVIFCVKFRIKGNYKLVLEYFFLVICIVLIKVIDYRIRIGIKVI